MSFEFGPSIIPLSAVGMIFNYTGNHLLQFIHAVYKRKIFYPCHTVTSVQMMPTGDIITTAIRKEVQIQLKEGGGGGGTGKFEIITKSETTVQFKSKAVVISHGGKQDLHPEFYKWFPCLEDQPEKVMLSDYFLRR